MIVRGFICFNTDQLDIRECLIFKCPLLKIVVHHQLFCMNSSKSIDLIEKSFMVKLINIRGCNIQKRKSMVFCGYFQSPDFEKTLCGIRYSKMSISQRKHM